ncbi:MAG: hypothetical protein QNJ19_17100 [Woeseiaceae bacterium]|nr:hypothetical protein [Woeseiaceae bacterium]
MNEFPLLTLSRHSGDSAKIMQKASRSKFGVCRLYISLATALALVVSCSSESGELGERYADECDAATDKYVDPAVFDGASQTEGASFMAAHAFEREVGLWNSGLKEGRRPDLELIVRYSDDSRGFECEVIGSDGYSIASVSSELGAQPNISYAKRVSDTEIAVMVGYGGNTPELHLVLAISPDGGTVERLYPSEKGYETAPGLSFHTDSDGAGESCDHRSGKLRRFAANQATVETRANGCENRNSQVAYESSPPFTYRYDNDGNRVEEMWVDELERPGRTEYRNELNGNGDWTKRDMLMESAAWRGQREIRTEHRHLRYRSTDR